MPRVASSHGASRPLLLGFLGLGGAGLVWWTWSMEAPRAGTETLARAASAALVPAQPEEPLGLVGPREIRAPAAALQARPTGPQEVLEPGTPARAEREFLASFLTLGRSQPGALEGRAAEILSGAGPDVEKVALLRALLECRSPEALTWLTRTVRTQPDRASPEARSVASQALAMLAGEAKREPAACRALAGLAFEDERLALGLRRRAASAYARHCSEAELDDLRSRLLHEPDAQLVAGARASLAERERTPRVERILLDFPAQPEVQAEE